MGLLEKIFGNYSEKEIKRITPIVDKIEALSPEFEKLSEEELKHKTTEFKERLSKGETLDQILPEAYAAVREAASRALGMRHFRVQLLGGIVMHQGRIAEIILRFQIPWRSAQEAFRLWSRCNRRDSSRLLRL